MIRRDERELYMNDCVNAVLVLYKDSNIHINRLIRKVYSMYGEIPICAVEIETLFGSLRERRWLSNNIANYDLIIDCTDSRINRKIIREMVGHYYLPFITYQTLSLMFKKRELLKYFK